MKADGLPTSFCQHPLLITMDRTPGTVSQVNQFSLQCLLSGCFLTATRSNTSMYETVKELWFSKSSKKKKWIGNSIYLDLNLSIRSENYRLLTGCEGLLSWSLPMDKDLQPPAGGWVFFFSHSPVYDKLIHHALTFS